MLYHLNLLSHYILLLRLLLPEPNTILYHHSNLTDRFTLLIRYDSCNLDMLPQ
jgi:hypothetical protein